MSYVSPLAPSVILYVLSCIQYGAVFTVAVQLAFLSLVDVTVITVVPIFFDVILPFEFTVAILGLLLVHVYFVIAFSGFAVTVNTNVKQPPDKIAENKLSENECVLLEEFNTLSLKKQHIALGVILGI